MWLRVGAPRQVVEQAGPRDAPLLTLAAEVPMKVVSDRLGHSTVTIAMNLYAKVFPVVARDAANRIAYVVPHGSRRRAEEAG